MVRPYDLIASRYDKMHDRWLRHAGGEAQAALEASLFSRVVPGDRVLDAGCGTGHLSRALAAHDPTLRLTLLDSCEGMLDQTRDVIGSRRLGSLLEMPFADNSFDVAVAAWAIEATNDEATAIAELMRVVRPGGTVLVAFCATEPPRRLAASVLRKGIEFRRTGRFLEAEKVEVAMHQCNADSVIRHRCNGPVAVIAARCGAANELRLAA